MSEELGRRPDAEDGARPALPPALLKVNEVCRRLAISQPSAYRLMDTGELPYVRLRGSRRVKPADLEALIERSTVSQHEEGAK